MTKLNLHFFKKLPEHEKKMTISTMFTLLRIGLIPFIIISMLFRAWDISFILFSIAAITDIIDGKLARLRNEKTFLGACLDPIADKILVISCFFTLAFVQSPLFEIPIWFLMLILIKELILIVGSIMLYGLHGHLEIQPTVLSKTTTLVQMIFISWLFTCYYFTWIPRKTYYAMLGIVIVLVLSTLAQYIRIGIRQFRF
jgi:cardiolipin synthase